MLLMMLLWRPHSENLRLVKLLHWSQREAYPPIIYTITRYLNNIGDSIYKGKQEEKQMDEQPTVTTDVIALPSPKYQRWKTITLHNI